MRGMGQVITSVQLPVELYEWVNQLAFSNGLAKRDVFIRALERYQRYVAKHHPTALEGGKPKTTPPAELPQPNVGVASVAGGNVDEEPDDLT